MRGILACAIGALAVVVVVRQGAPAAAGAVDYVRDVKPILAARCYACHGALRQKAGLRLDTGALLREGGDHGPAIVPGRSADSLLVRAVTGAPGVRHMPPKSEGGPLTAGQVGVLKAWIDQGARAPAEAPPPDPREHWAYRRPVRPPVPGVRNTAWVRNPIDAFVAAEHERRGLTPAPPAEPAVLLRRVYLDLAGLPPTRAELHAFLADPSDRAYEQVVDRLLASPRYAERWARHWMDVWRYSDWYGSRYIDELRNSRRHIWRWRDWLVESLARDKGYDRMVGEMLAGDELAPADANVQRALGFLGRSYYVFNRHVWMQDTVEYAGMALLGVTFKCCRCHDHKYDPIAQEEYYRFRAVFEPLNVRTDRIPGKPELLKGHLPDGAAPGATLKDGLDRVYDADLAAVTYLLERGNDKLPVKNKHITPGVPAVLGKLPAVRPVELPLEAFYPDLAPARRQEIIAEARAAVEKARRTQPPALAAVKVAAAEARLAAVEARIAAELARYAKPARADAHRLALAAGKAEREAALRQAEADFAEAERQPGKGKAADPARVAAARQKLAAARKAAGETTAVYTPLGPVYPQTSTGRRLALARWIGSRDNPLTARVAVNHIWLRHLGSALVPSVANFGLNGKRPTHPALLDWLAVEFMDRGWSTRALHRLIVTSSTYRMASEPGSAAVANQTLDPDNRLLWHANARRMEAEVVRDSVLYLADRLDETEAGPDLDPALADVSRRRSMYFRHTPDEKPVVLELFDAPNPVECFERFDSIVPQQALALANSDFSAAQARRIARLVAAPDDGSFVDAAFEQVLARPPDALERGRCLSFLQRQATRFASPQGRSGPGVASAVPPSADPRLRAREALVHVLLNYNEFVTIR